MACNGLLLVLMRPAAHLEEEFNEWYDTEHLADRLTAPGFLSGQRYRSIGGGPHAYVTLYDLESTGALETPEYLKLSRENFTPWTKRLMRRIPRLRVLAEQIHPGGAAHAPAPFVSIVRFSRVPDNAKDKIVNGIETCIGKHPATVQVRIFAQARDGGTSDCIGVVCSVARIADAINLEALDSTAAALDLIEEFAPYEIGMTWEKWI